MQAIPTYVKAPVLFTGVFMCSPPNINVETL